MHYHVDLLPERLTSPYMNLPPVAAAAVGSTVPPALARFADAIRRSDRMYPATMVTIVADCEINAFCAGGGGRGQYLGRCAWHWERTKGSGTRFGMPTPADRR